VESLETIIPGWRLSGVRGIGFFGAVQSYHLALAGKETPQRLELPDDLSTPDFYPENPLMGPYSPAFGTFFMPYFLKPTLATAAFRRVTAPLLAEFLEEGKDEYGLDHAWFSGAILHKKLLIINDSEEEQVVRGTVTLSSANHSVLHSFPIQARLPSGERMMLPIQIKLPMTANRIDGTLSAVLKAGSRKFSVNFPIEIFPAPAKLMLNRSLRVYDPDGKVIEYLKQQKIAFEELSSLDSLPKDGTLLVGRKALTSGSLVPDLQELVSAGVNILVLEQQITSAPELMEVRTRHAYINAPKHPVLNGFEGKDFSNWRDNVSLSDSYEINPPGYGWSAAGNRNMVASNVFRRPSHGNYLSLLVSGFDLYQTPLLEYRHQNASLLASQLEIVPRLGKDPVATTLFHRMLSYLDNRGQMQNTVYFYGGDQVWNYLKKIGVEAKRVNQLSSSVIATANVLILAEPDFIHLRNFAVELAEFVYHGGQLLYLNCGKKFDSVWLPFPLKMENKKVRNALVDHGAADSFWRCGWDNNDLYWHDEQSIPVFTDIPEQANATNPGVLVDLPHGTGRFTFFSIMPEYFADTPAAGKCSRILSALLTNAGVIVQNKSTLYSVQKNTKDLKIDLSLYNWSFAVDPQNIGMSEKIHQGAKGSLVWQSGLIADGCEVKLGRPFEQFLRYNYDGYAWYRLDLDIPAEFYEAEKLYLSIGAIDDADWIYVNGTEIGKTGVETPLAWCTPRVYIVPTKILRRGRNTILIRVFDKSGEGGVTKGPAVLGFRPVISSGRGWDTPYTNGVKRDYEYNPDIVRQY
jgi:hypothetical protein